MCPVVTRVKVEKMVLEQRLVQAEAKVCNYASENQRSQEHRHMVEAQLAAKQELRDLMGESQELEVRLQIPFIYDRQ